MGCLAAKMVCRFKNGVGIFYLYPEGVSDDWVDFTYTVYPSTMQEGSYFCIKVERFGDVLFEGSLCDYEAIDVYE